MENQDKNHTDEPIPKNHFTPNSRYFTILVYALAFVLGAILIYIFIGHFNVTLRLICFVSAGASALPGCLYQTV